METSIKIFENPEFGKVRIQMNASGEPMFCLADLCSALGVTNHRNVKNRLDEDDVRLVDTIDNMGRFQQVTFVTESGMYDVIIRSDAESAKPFRRWVTSVVLPSIRKTGGYVTTSTAVPKHEEQLTMKDKMNAATWAAKFLKLNDASKLLMAKQILEPTGLILPEYVNSKGFLLSADKLLKKNGINLNSHKFNLLMKEHGFIDYRERPSKSKGIKRFPILTEKGLKYGENQVSPQNQKETQIQYYEEKFPELLKHLGLQSQSQLF